uniref:Uncharacterized protein n=1 Tax=Knipowitschia caucasica TaxID=637954 RepID=A0AAV2JCQ1_KNICA
MEATGPHALPLSCDYPPASVSKSVSTAPHLGYLFSLLSWVQGVPPPNATTPTLEIQSPLSSRSATAPHYQGHATELKPATAGEFRDRIGHVPLRPASSLRSTFLHYRTGPRRSTPFSPQNPNQRQRWVQRPSSAKDPLSSPSAISVPPPLARPDSHLSFSPPSHPRPQNPSPRQMLTHQLRRHPYTPSHRML